MKKRILAAALSLCMIVTLLPISVFAAGDNPAEESWALSAVNTLNTLYKTDVFTASGEVMTETEVQAVLAVMGNENYSGLGTGDLTRSGACEVLTDIFK